MITLKQLLSTASEDDALSLVKSTLASLGFSVRSWQAGSNQVSMLRAFARLYAANTDAIAAIAAGGYSSLAKGPWLTLLASDRFGNDRILAVSARHTVRLACSTVSGPYTLEAGEIVLSTSDGRNTFRNVAQVVIPSGGTIDAEFEAERPGAGGNVAINSIVVVATALAGVSCSNPASPTGGPSITRDGSDEETDAQLHTRNISKWGTLGLPVRKAYVYHCRTASPACKRVYVDTTNPNGPGTIAIYLAGDSGELSDQTVGVVRRYLTGATDGIQRVGLHASFTVTSALRRTVLLRGTVYVIAAYNTPDTQQSILDAVNDYLKDAPIGGVGASDTADGIVPAGALYGAMLGVAGVRNFAPDPILVDTAIKRGEVAVAEFQLSFVSV